MNHENSKVLVKMYPAKNGDSFLLTFNSPKPVNVLIDGGFASTFNDYILSDLIFKSSNSQKLDLIIATHIDQDHILGLIEFFKQNVNSSESKIIAVENVLHNSVRCLTYGSSATPRSDDIDLLNEIRNQGYPVNEVVIPPF